MRRRALPALLLTFALLLLAGCGSEGGGESTGEGTAQPTEVEPVAPSAAAVGEVNSVQEEAVESDPTVRMEKVLRDAGAIWELLNRFWTRELAALYNIPFDPPDSFVYYEGTNGSSCGGTQYVARNAWYCFADLEEEVSFDLDWFQQYLISQPGGATTFLILAHEWGHAVQDTWLENGGTDIWEPPNKELNADCLAGVFISRSIREGTIIEEPGDAEAIFGWLYEVGGPWLEPGSHGTKAERQAAFQNGIQRGTQYCRTVY